MKYDVRYGVVGFFIIMPLIAMAQPTTVTVKVTVISQPPCIINENKDIQVKFGGLVASRVDGIRYLQVINYNLECKDQSNNAMKISIQGSPSSFDNTALKTNIDGFAIALYANGKRLAPNSWVEFIYPNKPVLKAVPIKESELILPKGVFSASATMMIAYQ